LNIVNESIMIRTLQSLPRLVLLLLPQSIQNLIFVLHRRHGSIPTSLLLVGGRWRLAPLLTFLVMIMFVFVRTNIVHLWRCYRHRRRKNIRYTGGRPSWRWIRRGWWYIHRGWTDSPRRETSIQYKLTSVMIAFPPLDVTIVSYYWVPGIRRLQRKCQWWLREQRWHWLFIASIQRYNSKRPCRGRGYCVFRWVPFRCRTGDRRWMIPHSQIVKNVLIFSIFAVCIRLSTIDIHRRGVGYCCFHRSRIIRPSRRG